MNFHPDVLAAHAQFGGDLESMQKLYEYLDLKSEVIRLRAQLDEARKALKEIDDTCRNPVSYANAFHQVRTRAAAAIRQRGERG